MVAIRAGFQLCHWLEDLMVPADYFIDQAWQLCKPLALTFINLEKAFNFTDYAAILNLIHSHYYISLDSIHTIQWLYTDVTSLVPIADSSFQATKRVKWGCPCCSLLFGLFSKKVVYSLLYKLHFQTLTTPPQQCLLHPLPSRLPNMQIIFCLWPLRLTCSRHSSIHSIIFVSPPSQN